MRTANVRYDHETTLAAKVDSSRHPDVSTQVYWPDEASRPCWRGSPMMCPRCGNHESRVGKTASFGGVVTRYRQCQCGAAWRTEEKLVRGSLTAISGLLVVTNRPGVISSPDLFSVTSSSGSRSRSGSGARDPYGKASGLKDFALWYANYPRKVAKAEAMKAWRQVGGDQIADLIIAGLAAQLPFWAWQPPTMRPHPASWLRGRRWEDDPAEYPDTPPILARPSANGAHAAAERRDEQTFMEGRRWAGK